MNRTRRWAAGLCAATTMVFGTLTWAASPAGAQTATCTVSSTDQAVDAEEQALLNLVNQYRQANGKNALAMEATVTRAAAWFSRDMATKNYFPYDHVDSNGRSISQRLTWCGVSYSNWAENIYAGRSDAQSVFDAWKASSGHNANMLRDGITSAGIARSYGSGTTYGWYWVLDVTNTSAGTPTSTTTTTTPTATTTTTTRPASGPAPGTPEWYALYYPQYFGTTTTTRPVSTATTTTTAPTQTTTTTRPPTTGPAPGSPEWWMQYYAQYLNR